MEIPIRNLYALLLYAWDRLEEGGVVDVEGLEEAGAADLLGRVLATGTRHVLRRGIERGYHDHTEPTTRLRGRVAFGPSLQQMLLPQARAVCTFDELTPDTLANRILRTTLGKLARVRGLDARVDTELRQVYRQMKGVGTVRITGALFGQVRLHANNAFYRFLLSVCALAHANLLPDEAGGGARFRDFTRDEAQMAQLFERFVLGFYRAERPDLRVQGEQLDWGAEAEAVEGPGRLPAMYTDVTLRGPGWTLVLDAKYYREALKSRHGAAAFSSANLYQLTAYLRALEARGGADAEADGVLLYPAVRHSFDHVYRLRSHRLRLMTVDLAAPLDEIRKRLLEIPSWSAARLAATSTTSVVARSISARQTSTDVNSVR